MGLLSLGTPLEWEQVKPHIDHVRYHGISQFLNIWNRIKARRKDHLLWGDEIEYCLVKFDHASKTAVLDLNAPAVLESLQEMEEASIAAGNVFPSSWKPEYAKYMLEGTPGVPYGYQLQDLLDVEENMKKRRQLAISLLNENQALLSITNFPLLGSQLYDFVDPVSNPDPDSCCSRSLFIPNEAITDHARFPTLTHNIRTRRGSKVAMNVPIFRDENTANPFNEPLPSCLVDSLKTKGLPIPTSLPEYCSDALTDHIYMDAMCFGMGCSCLQVTVQACSVEDARRLYDQLAPIAPLMMAISAGAPIFRGYLADVDCRWAVIAGAVDDRTPEERGLQPLKTSTHRIKKSRYDSISRYLSSGPSYSGGCSGNSRDVAETNYYKPEYNDLDVAINEDVYHRLIEGGVDELLAHHYAHLFIRDPLVVFRELLDVDDMESSDHFENIQSTNWQTMRFKPPPPSAKNMGWRVEFRSMEVQLTDHENAAFSIFVVLLVRAIMKFNLNFYIPLSKVDANLVSAQQRDAIHTQKFWFRKSVIEDPVTYQNIKDESKHVNGSVDLLSGHTRDDYDEYDLNTLFNGSETFYGLASFVDKYVDSEPIDQGLKDKLKTYVKVIRQRASGERLTGATWIRNFVRSHPKYAGDSVVSDEINYDLMARLKTLQESDLLV